MKSDRSYYADIQSDIIKRVAKMSPKDRFGRWLINLDGYDYSMYILENGAFGYVIPHQYDVISSINTMMPNMLNGVAPESVHSFVGNTDLIECNVVDVFTVDDVTVAELRADGEAENIWVNFKFFKKFYQHKENYSYKFSKFGVKHALYIFRGDVLVAVILAIRQGH